MRMERATTDPPISLVHLLYRNNDCESPAGVARTDALWQTD